MGVWDGSGISWTICKQSAPHSRQITTPAPHHSIFTGPMLFLTPNQQCQSTEGTVLWIQKLPILVCVSGAQVWLSRWHISTESQTGSHCQRHLPTEQLLAQLLGPAD